MSQYPEGRSSWEPPREPEPEFEYEPEAERTRIDPFATPAPQHARPWEQRDQWGPPTSSPVSAGWEPGPWADEPGAFGAEDRGFRQTNPGLWSLRSHSVAADRTGALGGPPPTGEPVWAPPPVGEPAWGPPPAQFPTPGQYPTSGQYPSQPPQYGRPGDPWGGRPLVGEERAWVPASHWLPLLTSWLGPLVVLLTVGERNARVREHAKESLNFEITLWLGLLLSALLAHVLVGFLFLILLPLLAVVLRVVATVESIRGRTHRYPFALRIVR